MNPILHPGKNLPPGLLVPTPEEDTSKFLTKSFLIGGISEEDILDYGTFVVGLALLTAEETDRISMMPTEKDIQELHREGYGIANRTLNSHGGLRKLQSKLGFCPSGADMSKEDLICRFSWLANCAYVVQEGREALENVTIEELMKWGTARDLVPSSERVRKTFDGDTLPLRQSLGIVRKHTSGTISKQELYSFGQKILDQHGRPLRAHEMAKLYPNEFISGPYEVIRWNFGSMTEFWMNFDKVAYAEKLQKNDILNMGIRWNIRYGRTSFTNSLVNQLSKDEKFVSRTPIIKFFGGVPAFNKAVEDGYREYEVLEKELEIQGVKSSIVRLACMHNYSNTPNFNNNLRSKVAVLLKLSHSDSRYVSQIIDKGFNLIDKEVFKMQLEDVHRELKKIKIVNEDEINFIFSLIPRYEM